MFQRYVQALCATVICCSGWHIVPREPVLRVMQGQKWWVVEHGGTYWDMSDVQLRVTHHAALHSLPWILFRTAIMLTPLNCIIASSNSSG